MTTIPRSASEWAAIAPNETDERLAAAWRASLLGNPDTPEARNGLAAAARLHEHERCVAALAKSLYAQFEDQRRSLHPSEVPDMDWCVDEARRILGCEPESGEKGGSNG